MDIPRKEYPRPQFQRKEWINLNGPWNCAFDFGKTGKERGFASAEKFDKQIIVPFCPESSLSGVQYTDLIPAFWYQRKITIPAEWKGKKILFHCGGIDYLSEIYLDGKLAGAHTGGSSPVTIDLTRFAKPGEEQNLTVYAEDDVRSGIQPRGKQSYNYKSSGCSYTRTTGIWQTVWLEAVSPLGLRECVITPDFDNGSFSFAPSFFEVGQGSTLTIRILDNGVCAGEATLKASNSARCTIALKDPKAWEPGNPFLYDVELTVKDSAGKVLDAVTSYCGLRKFHVEGRKLFFNNKPIYLRFVLDQGFYPDGIWTAPSDEALKNDIQLSMQAGFNGARLHQKVFEERFHYWADKLGYLTSAEFSDWGMSFWHAWDTVPNTDYYRSFRDYLTQWNHVVVRDRNHPSIILWTPFNETNGPRDIIEHRRIIRDVYELTKMLDPTRPVSDTSGYIHVVTDIWTAHCYEADPEILKEKMDRDPVYATVPEKELEFYDGHPFFLDEYGGVSYLAPERKVFADNSWGYGGSILNDPAPAIERIRKQTRVLLDHWKLCGYCYTQLTDIEQEQNGVYYYDRTPKFDMAVIRAIFGEKPEWSAY